MNVYVVSNCNGDIAGVFADEKTAKNVANQSMDWGYTACPVLTEAEGIETVERDSER